MKRTPLLVLMLCVVTFLSSCATTHDLPEKYASYIGKQFRTRDDAHIWKLAPHQYEFTPYNLSESEGYHSTRLDLIPAGTIITIKAAKRSYAGGDWDYLIVEVRAPESGKVYTFEHMLGFSSYFPGDIEKMWEPVDKPAGAKVAFNSEDHFNAPNGRFSIRKTAFVTPPSTWSVTEPPDQGSFSFNFPKNGIVRIDYWITAQQPMANWTKEPPETNMHDRMIDSVVDFTRSKTSWLDELTLLARRPSAETDGTSSGAAFRMRIGHGEYAGSYYRGFVAFAHGVDSYIIHYQTSETFINDKTGGEAVLAKLVALKDAMVFHDK